MSSEFFSDETGFAGKFDLEIIPRVFCLANDSFQIFSDFRFHLSTQVLIGKSKPEIGDNRISTKSSNRFSQVYLLTNFPAAM